MKRLYTSYTYNKSELLIVATTKMIKYMLIGYLFFNHWLLMILAGCFGLFEIQKDRRRRIKAGQEQIKHQFKEASYLLATALSAGKSVEQAFIYSYEELCTIYSRDASICEEWAIIVQGIHTNETLDKRLSDFADRSGVADIRSFCRIFETVRRSGGDLVNIIRNTTKTLDEKQKMEEALSIEIAGKVYEQRLMSLLVPGMVLFFKVTSPAFIEPLYQEGAGRLIMVLALSLYLIIDWLSQQIMTIEVV